MPLQRSMRISHEHARLLRSMEVIGRVSDTDRALVTSLPMRIRQFGEDTDLVREGDRPNECCLLVDGLACRYKLLAEGQRQILSFHLAGDVPDLQSLHLGVMDHSLGTLTPGSAAYIPHAALGEVTDKSASLTAIFWRITLIDAAIFREWLAGVGRRTAHQRVAHLICEFFVRMRALGLADGKAMDLALTQAEIADALGLSTVHVNRVLQDLRRDGLIASEGKRMLIKDWPRLKQVGDFDPTYLHLLPDALSRAD
ncbi:MAG: Crp/Fnr family transcriptional regulator [Phenylobacterium sp.]